MCTETPAACRERFARIDARLKESEGQLMVLTARLGEKINMLANSMRALTRALWGVAGAVITALLGFFFWYVQSL